MIDFYKYTHIGVLSRQMNLRYHQMFPTSQIHIFWKVLINHTYYVSDQKKKKRGAIRLVSSEMTLPRVNCRLAGIVGVWTHSLLHDIKDLEPCRLQPKSFYLFMSHAPNFSKSYTKLFFSNFISLTKACKVILCLTI